MSREAMKLALEALENSADLVSNEAREAEKMYANVPTRLARVQGLVALEVAHEKAITALREELAEQPAPMIHGDIRDGLVDDEPAQQELGRNHWEDGDVFERIGAMKKQPAQQEPVAWALSHSRGIEFNGKYPMQSSRDEANRMAQQHLGTVTVTPLYTSPPAQRTWVGLTDEEREQHRNDWHSNIHDKEFRAIEAKLKEKNNG